MANNPTLTWQKSPSSNVENYQVQWIYNSANAALVNVPQSATGDASGYSTDFVSQNPTVTLKGGDVVSCSIIAQDTVNNLASAPITPAAVTIPTAPTAPQPPQNVVLALA